MRQLSETLECLTYIPKPVCIQRILEEPIDSYLLSLEIQSNVGNRSHFFPVRVQICFRNEDKHNIGLISAHQIRSYIWGNGAFPLPLDPPSFFEA